MACDCSPVTKTIILVCVGVILIVIGLVAEPIINLVIHQEVKVQLVLKEDTEVYTIWEDPPFPIYQKFYMFNINNPEEMTNGAKPNVSEIGPYTYREYRVKDNITFSNDSNYVTYGEKRYYVFERDLSVGSENDSLVTINALLPAISQLLNNSDFTTKQFFNIVMKGFNETLVHTKSIYEVLWGYKEPMLTAGHLIAPHWFETDIVGFMAGKNDSYDGFYKISTGKEDIQDLGAILLYNGSSYLNFWTTPYANMVNGTDGSLHGPFVTKSTVLYTFITDACRSLPGVFNKEGKTKYDVNIYEFIPPDSTFDNSSVNPDNIGFCTPQSNCLGTGVLNVSSCQIFDHIHLPVVLSRPHLMGADPKYLDDIEGLHPDPVKHETIINVEPITGIMMEASKKLQANIYIIPDPNFADLTKVRHMMLPIMWIEEETVVDKNTTDKLDNMLFKPIRIANALRYTVIAIGGVFVLSALIYITVIEVKKEPASANAPANNAVAVYGPILHEALQNFVKAMRDHVQSLPPENAHRDLEIQDHPDNFSQINGITMKKSLEEHPLLKPPQVNS